jgi:hypothetical protein
MNALIYRDPRGRESESFRRVSGEDLWRVYRICRDSVVPVPGGRSTFPLREY